MKSTIAVFLLLAARSLHAVDRDPAGFERVLIPLVFQSERPGAYGSRWVSDLIIRNESDSPVQIFQSECSFFCECVGFECETVPTPAHSRFGEYGAFDSFNPTSPGALIYIGRSAGSAVAMQSRIRDVSRLNQSWGTEVPVVRESDLLSGTAYLLDVPLDPRFRLHLRAYAVSSLTGEAHLRATVLDDATGEILAVVPLRLNPGGVGGQAGRQPLLEGQRPSHPAYAEIGALHTLIPAGRGTTRLRVMLTPESPGLKYWAFLAITNNDTQHVTLVTPQ